jgi:hypothetical protein
MKPAFKELKVLKHLKDAKINFPFSVLIYLSRFPENSILKQFRHIILWILLYSAIELFFHLIHLFDYWLVSIV